MISDSVQMYYFGPWDCAGHFMYTEGGASVSTRKIAGFPWDEWSGENGIDGQLQPNCVRQRNGLWLHGAQPQGEALLHHKDGWTALSFWDRSVDERGGCNSTYFAEGMFTFDEMVEAAKRRFSHRWNKMKFQVVPSDALRDKGAPEARKVAQETLSLISLDTD